MKVLTTVDHPAEVIRLFRALLRESTYLPDPQARIYVWSHVVARFRENKNQTLRTEYRQRHLTREARKSLGILRNANNGKLDQLQKVLFCSYGRAGKRRHELLKPLLQFDHQRLTPHPREDSEKSPPWIGQHGKAVTSSLVEQAMKVNRPSDFTPQLPSRLTALVESQVSASPPDYVRPLLGRRLLQLRLPDKNNLGRRLPRRRIPNIIRKWYGSVLERALPPLPAEEWHRLKGLITGEIPWEGPRKRRPGNENSKPAAAGSPELVLNQALNLATKEPKPPSPMHGDHHLTLRFMQRLWTKVFSICPLMVWDSQNKTWKVEWGHRSILQQSYSISENDTSLFSGVDKQGKTMTDQLPVPKYPTLASTKEQSKRTRSSEISSLSPEMTSAIQLTPAG